MTPQSFIFIGRSGCGKGTQIRLLIDYLKKIDLARKTLNIQGGVEFREFVKGSSITQKLSKVINDNGMLQPEFLSVYIWTHILVRDYTEDSHLIIDGMPRKYHEAGVLDSIFDFYGLEKAHVIYIDISREEAVKRLLARKRVDDLKEEIEKRLEWFETDVVPTIEYYKNNSRYKFYDINGERSVEEIHKDIINQLVF